MYDIHPMYDTNKGHSSIPSLVQILLKSPITFQ